LRGDRCGRLLRAQFFGVGEHPFEDLPGFRFDQLVDADFAGFVRVAGEGGVDDDAFAVADDEQRRVFQLQGVVGELLEGGVEVASRLLVLPAEMAALPDIGPAIAATGFAGAALEAVVVGSRGFSTPSRSQRSLKCCCAPARSVVALFFQWAMNCSGVMAVAVLGKGAV
jgi:hypothetical protein